jgi:hypothetical protein
MTDWSWLIGCLCAAVLAVGLALAIRALGGG